MVQQQSNVICSTHLLPRFFQRHFCHFAYHWYIRCYARHKQHFGDQRNNTKLRCISRPFALWVWFPHLDSKLCYIFTKQSSTCFILGETAIEKKAIVNNHLQQKYNIPSEKSNIPSTAASYAYGPLRYEWFNFGVLLITDPVNHMQSTPKPLPWKLMPHRDDQEVYASFLIEGDQRWKSRPRFIWSSEFNTIPTGRWTIFGNFCRISSSYL